MDCEIGTSFALNLVSKSLRRGGSFMQVREPRTREIKFIAVCKSEACRTQLTNAFRNMKTNCRISAMFFEDYDENKVIAEEYGVPSFGISEFKSFVDSHHIDAIFLQSSTRRCVDVCQQIVNRGIHVICDPDTELTHIGEMKSICSNAGVHFVRASQNANLIATATALELARSGKAGQPCSVYSAHFVEDTCDANKWRSHKSLVNLCAVQMLAIHRLVQNQNAEMVIHKATYSNAGNLNSINIQLQFANDCRAQIVCEFSNTNHSELKMKGTIAEIEVQHETIKFRSHDATRTRQFLRSDQLAYEIDRFSSRILDPMKYEQNQLNESNQLQVIANAIIDSLAKQQAIIFDSHFHPQNMRLTTSEEDSLVPKPFIVHSTSL